MRSAFLSALIFLFAGCAASPQPVPETLSDVNPQESRELTVSVESAATDDIQTTTTALSSDLALSPINGAFSSEPVSKPSGAPLSSEEQQAGPLSLMVAPPPGGGVEPDDAEPELAQETPPDEPQTADVDDLWDRIRAGLTLSEIDHPRMQPHVDWFSRHQAYLDRVVERAQPYLHDIVQQVEQRDMPLEIALLPVVESGFQPFAYSHGRAAGIWQFIPGTGTRFGLKQNWWYDGRRDIMASTRAALDYLEYLNSHFGGDWMLALAAYNSGEGTVRAAVRKNSQRKLHTDFWSLDLPKETRDYVPKLLAIARIVANPEQHGLTLLSLPNEPFLEPVDVGTQIDLALAAELAELPLKDVYTYNPAFNRWATAPDGPHTLLVPIENAETLRANLADLPADRRIQWERHQIRNGETLLSIAKRYQTSVDVIRDINGINGKLIRAGHNLIIPVATRSLESYVLSADQRRDAIQNTPRKGTKTQHTVRSGETLWQLARNYRVSVENLAAWNAMAPRDPLRPGQQLVVWTQATGKGLATLQSARRDALPASATQQRLQYKVRKGDSLAQISKKFQVTVAQLRKWNDLPKNKYLQPGQLLTLYVDVTRQSENI